MNRSRIAFLLAVATTACAQPARAPTDYRNWALIRGGSAERGRAIFHAPDRVACAVCHSIDGSNSKAGPDLLAVGDALPRRDLITALLEPNATIAVGYGATIVETKSGATHLGVIKRADATGVAVMGADGKLIPVAAADLKSQQPSPLSLMPEGLHAALSLQEFADLIDYLASLKQPANSLTAHRGMPDEIPPLAKLATLRPLLPEALRFPHTVVKQPGDVRLGLTWFGQIPGEENAFLVAHQSGKIWRLERGPEGFTKTLFADFSAEVFNRRGPNGLLGVAFHPRFRENRRYFEKHQIVEGDAIATLVVERRASADFRTDSGEPPRVLMKIPAVTQNHTGGTVAFGPDGMLYCAMGDTGPQQDPNGHGQDLGLLLGKMLRIDVDRRDPGLAYAIPPDNPFVGRAGVRPEIWALGFREPWRFSFDRATGDLWVGDVGQDRVEEVAIVRRGENHGWNVVEGFEPFSNLRRREGELYAPPVAAYRRRYGNSVTGGHVYRGGESPSFDGVYIFGDYTSRMIFGLTQRDGKLESLRHIATAPESVTSFAQDERGRLYVLSYEGMIFELDLSGAEFERAAPAAKAKTIAWERRAFPLPESIWSVEAIDANNDGQRELIAMGVTQVYAIEHTSWRTSTIFDAKDGKLLYCVALDANADGATDLALGRYLIPWIESRKPPVAGKAAPPAPVGPDFSVAWLQNPRRGGGNWKLHVVDRELNGIHGLHAADVNGDGRTDVIADSISGPAFPNSVAWFDLAAPEGSHREVVTSAGADGRPHYLDFADIDGDGRGDILLGDSGGGTFTWWKRGAPGEPWTKHRIAHEKGATNLRAVDVDRDGRIDVVGAAGHGKGVFWFSGPGWVKHVIDADLATPHALAVGDFDGDGDIDVAVASYTAFITCWYENDGRGKFTPHDIDTGNKQQAYDLKATDLDADGRLDLILAGRESKNAVVYFNRRP
ncbi:MAG: PQQ-dependent sugar dehydrogenase [Opitutaceae bacterium]|nr:PQQ-dependent sugar dehydrogenase [Opitutaceae bacterium]